MNLSKGARFIDRTINVDFTCSQEAQERGTGNLDIVAEGDLEVADLEGIGIGDFNLDGKLDLVKTHFSDDTTALYRKIGRAHV